MLVIAHKSGNESFVCSNLDTTTLNLLSFSNRLRLSSPVLIFTSNSCLMSVTLAVELKASFGSDCISVLYVKRQEVIQVNCLYIVECLVGMAI